MSEEADTQQAEHTSLLRRAGKNFGKLLSGRGVAALLELLSIALVARTLTPDYLGYIVLAQSYVLVVRGLLNFKLYEVLVRFGVPLLEGGDKEGFRDLLRLSLFIDFASCFIAMLIAVAAAPLVGKLLGWDAELPVLTMIYSTSLLTYGFGTAKGVLRIFDRYNTLSIQLMIGPVLRVGGILVVMAIRPDVFWYVIALTIATSIGNAVLIERGWSELKRQTGAMSFKGFSLRGWNKRFPGLKSFIGIVYWQSNVDLLPKQIGTLLAGTLLGPAGAGYLRLAAETTKILSKPGSLLRQVLFPDMVRMWVRRNPVFGKLLSRALLLSALFGGLFTVASVFGGSLVFGTALGEGYAKAGPLLTLLLAAATLELLATVMRSAGYAMGHAGKILRLHLVSAVIYLAAFVLLTRMAGLLGPGLAACVAATVPLAGVGMLVLKSMRGARLGQ